jgi:hypothetical protein
LSNDPKTATNSNDCNIEDKKSIRQVVNESVTPRHKEKYVGDKQGLEREGKIEGRNWLRKKKKKTLENGWCYNQGFWGIVVNPLKINQRKKSKIHSNTRSQTNVKHNEELVAGKKKNEPCWKKK